MRYAIFDATNDPPFVLFFPALIVATILFDHSSGIFTAALSAVLSVCLFMRRRPAVPDQKHRQAHLFCSVGVSITIAVAWYRAALSATDGRAVRRGKVVSRIRFGVAEGGNIGMR